MLPVYALVALHSARPDGGGGGGGGVAFDCVVPLVEFEGLDVPRLRTAYE